MQLKETARPLASWQAGQGNGRGKAGVINAQAHCSAFQPVALQVAKRGRLCTIAKLVDATPLNEIVLAMPYRHRQAVEHVSIPPVVLRYARQSGARLWIVRLDAEGRCFALALAEVDNAAGWLKPSEGSPEWFVAMSKFQAIAWQDWPFVEATIRLDDVPSGMRPAQLTMWG